ncbi:hypothetical protein Ahy_B02g059345 [Arachis hypogaea]|uniref:Aminotransferase-like plant mobile domain-containing protein n=1 Tax=Arachis hypogaea TaxID=3818 RepID=A0A445AGI0_ARAHY|nr:hypothetical protein Ahy_B02g059345 [Arachis hypogaea]
MYLLGGILLADKANNTVHVQYFSLLDNYDVICNYSWDNIILYWLYQNMYSIIDYNFNWLSYADPCMVLIVPGKSQGEPHGDFYIVVVPLIFFRWIEILNVDKVLRKFGGKQGPPNPPLNINTFHC